MTTISPKIQALQIWNNMTAMQRMSATEQAGATKYLKHGVKRAFDVTLNYIEANLGAFQK